MNSAVLMNETHSIRNTYYLATKCCLLVYVRCHESIDVVLVKNSSPAASSHLIIESAVILG